MFLSLTDQSGKAGFAVLLVTALGAGTFLTNKAQEIGHTQKAVRLNSTQKIGQGLNMSALALAKAALTPKPGFHSPISFSGGNFIGNDTPTVKVINGNLQIANADTLLSSDSLNAVFANGAQATLTEQLQTTTTITPLNQSVISGQTFIDVRVATVIDRPNTLPVTVRQTARLAYTTAAGPATPNGNQPAGSPINNNPGSNNPAGTPLASQGQGDCPGGGLAAGNSSANDSLTSANGSGTAGASASGDQTSTGAEVVDTGNGIKSTSCAAAVSNNGNVASASGSSSAGGATANGSVTISGGSGSAGVMTGAMTGSN